MPRFSKQSLDRLATCHPDLQRLLHEVIKEFDVIVLCGHRSVAEQSRLYAQGRTAPGKKVTNIDGVRIKGRHNYKPALAVDLAPYPLDWSDTERFREMGSKVKEVAARLEIPATWGGDWKRFKDLPHFELPLSARLDA
jgi:peptidoglycan L-alanyl-D-glutamate endopeptidase CwlK